MDGITLDDSASQPYQASYYDELPGDSSTGLGGGAVGLVPFNVYGTDCDPPNNPTDACTPTLENLEWPAAFDSVNHVATWRDTIIVRFYGPVFDHADTYGGSDDPSTKPVVVSLKSVAVCYPSTCDSDLPDWTDMTGSFDVYVPGNGSREVWISRVLDETGTPLSFDWEYGVKVTPKVESETTQLRSDKTLIPHADAPPTAGTYILWPYCEDRDFGGRMVLSAE